MSLLYVELGEGLCKRRHHLGEGGRPTQLQPPEGCPGGEVHTCAVTMLRSCQGGVACAHKHARINNPEATQHAQQQSKPHPPPIAPPLLAAATKDLFWRTMRQAEHAIAPPHNAQPLPPVRRSQT